MKRGKDGQKIMEPMFPRLHVKDAEKGGPRAPPRNKMALYEQLSIPSHRFSHVVLPNSMPPVSQGGGNDRGMSSGQLPLRHPAEQQYSQYSDLSSPSAHAEKRKKLDDNDYRVPDFDPSTSSQEFNKFSNDMNQERRFPSNAHSFIHKKKPNETDTIEHGEGQTGEILKEKYSQGFMSGWVKSISYSSSAGKSEDPKKQIVSSLGRKLGHEHGNSIDRLRTNDRLRTEIFSSSMPSDDRHFVADENMAEAARKHRPSPKTGLPSENYDDMCYLSNDSESNEVERGDSVSETSILDTISPMDVTPDDVVNIIGQKCFWKARRAIANQQRAFAFQVFELHRLIKVQKLIAASPHLMLEDSAYLSKPIKPLSGKKMPVKPVPNPPKLKDSLEKPKDKKEGSAENIIEKVSPSSAQNQALSPPNCQPEPSTISNNDHNAKQWCYNQPQGHQWLVPVMSPSEGLIYKPYPGPGFAGPSGSIPPMMGNFFTPAYGISAPPTSQYQLPSFPHGYFPPYNVTIMNTGALSGSSVEQASRTISDTVNSHISKDCTEVQASTASIPCEKRRGNNTAERRNMLPLFPTSPALNASKVEAVCVPRPTGVIRVVPHNAMSASESAARIFRAIQEGREQYGSL